jgi:hypothetical protein
MLRIGDVRAARARALGSLGTARLRLAAARARGIPAPFLI